MLLPRLYAYHWYDIANLGVHQLICITDHLLCPRCRDIQNVKCDISLHPLALAGAAVTSR
jgi:hypothetical protein